MAPTTQALKHPNAEAVIALPEIAEANYVDHHTRNVLFFPLFTKGYDYRFVIQAFAPLLAAAALAAWGLVVRVGAGPRVARLLGRERSGSAQPPRSPRR